MKKCKSCQADKDESEFYKRTCGRLFADCKECTKEHKRMKYLKSKGSLKCPSCGGELYLPPPDQDLKKTLGDLY